MIELLIIYSMLIDAVLLSPSAYGLQQLLLKCDEYSKDHNISFNVDKTVCMCIKPSWMVGKIYLMYH